MMGKLWTKVGGVLVGGFLLGSGLFLAVQHVQAHDRGARLPSLSCSNLPDDGFFPDVADVSITPADPTPSASTERGDGVANTGSRELHYAKITIPALAAGELRVFHTGGTQTDTTATAVSNAILCKGTTRVTDSIMSYSAHDDAHRDAETADNAAAAATAATTYHFGPDGVSGGGDDRYDLATLSGARGALNYVRGRLSTAQTALNNVRIDLERYPAATAAAGTVQDDQIDALTDYNASAYTNADDIGAITTKFNALIDAADGLGEAATALTNAATALRNVAAAGEHTRFQLRAPVAVGDEEYVVVVAMQNESPAGAPREATENAQTLSVAFRGVISEDSTAGRIASGQPQTRTLTVTTPGLLTVETTGSTDTRGQLGTMPSVRSGGGGDNFKMVVPVTNGAPVLTIRGETQDTSGTYDLLLTFDIAMGTATVNTGTAATIAAPSAGAWPTGATGVSLPDDTIGAGNIFALQDSGDEDVFLLTIGTNSGFLTVEAEDDGTSDADANTTGILYGATGEIDTDTDSGVGGHFSMRIPAQASGNYLLKVNGSAGAYKLSVTLTEIEGAADAQILTVPNSYGNDQTNADCTSNDRYEICPSSEPEIERHLLTIPEAGALYVETRGSIDTVGVLYGPDGGRIAQDDNSGPGNNFRIAVQVRAGLHIVEVRPKAGQTTGTYRLVTNLVAGAQVEDPTDPTDPGTGDDVAELRAQVTQLQRDLDTCEAGVETDARGTLGNPSGTAENPGHRSGIGVISGWVCAANEVTVEISRGGVVQETLDVAYGTSRPDVPLDPNADCTNANAGFGMTYNFNHLPEGEYTIQAFADDERFGSEQTFEVVHLTGFAQSDTNRFLEDLPAGTCDVEDFPEDGDATRLRWEQSTQNFVIEDAG